MSSMSSNFNSEATVENGLCLTMRFGCSRLASANYHPSVTNEDGSCLVAGCTSSLSWNYLRNANLDDGSCENVRAGCRDPAADNYDSRALAERNSCIYLGCTDSLSTAYSAFATHDDGSCGSPLNGCGNSNAENYLPGARFTDASACAIRGCTWIGALNFDPAASVDDNSCVWRKFGCTFSAALNYMPAATDEDGTCYLMGCTDKHADTFNPTATVSDGSCVVVLGCTNSESTNYHSLASHDDGSCTFVGCRDPNAINFDHRATLDGGNCEALPAGFEALVQPGRRPKALLVFDDTRVRHYEFIHTTPALSDPLHTSRGEEGRAGHWMGTNVRMNTNAGVFVVIGDESKDEGAGAVYVVHLAFGGVALYATLPAGTVTMQDGRNTTNTTLLLEKFDHFGSAVLSIKDLNGDGLQELVVGARGDDEVALNSGAIYVLHLDLQGRIRNYTKVTGAVMGGGFGSALCALPSDPEKAPGAQTIFIGAPGELNFNGAIYAIQLTTDGDVGVRIKLSASTLGVASLRFATHVAFGASLAAKSRGLDTYELSVGVPGFDGDLGAVITLEMDGLSARNVAWYRPTSEIGHAFGASLTYSTDVYDDGARKLFVGSRGTLHVLRIDLETDSGNRSAGMKYERNERRCALQLMANLSPAEHAPIKAHAIAVFGEQGNSSNLPLFWLSRTRNHSTPRGSREGRSAPEYGLKILRERDDHVHDQGSTRPNVFSLISAHAARISIGASCVSCVALLVRRSGWLS